MGFINIHSTANERKKRLVFNQPSENARLNLAKVSDDAAIRTVCEEVLKENPAEVQAYRGGKATLMGWFVGQVMKKMRGKADPALARKILEELLG